jgi:tRNA(Ile)-lysidine synthase
VSGGPDSVALLDVLQRIDGGVSRLVVAHLNHAIRGDESQSDMAFVEKLARDRSLPFASSTLMHADSKQQPKRAATVSEGTLRQRRLEFLLAVAREYSAVWVATGHHADDCVETMLHHLLRGSGPRGLASIPATRELGQGIRLIRPLRSVFRNSIVEYLGHHQLEYRVDSTNAENVYTRNRIRHQLLPWLREFCQDVAIDERIFQASDLIREQQETIDLLADRWLSAVSSTGPIDEFRVVLEACGQESWPIVQAAMVQIWERNGWPLREMSYRHWQSLRGMLQPSSNSPHPRRLQLPGGIEVRVQSRIVQIVRLVGF